jgi:protein-S-isoprenylcysteine O-methyltransferase Ste14
VSDIGSDAPNVRIVPPLVYLAGLVIGLVVTAWVPTQLVPRSVAWGVGALLALCGATLMGSALVQFRRAGTTVRPDRAPVAFVIKGPYRFTRNPMYLGQATLYLGISIAAQSLWMLILLPIVLVIIQHFAIMPEESFLERRFARDYTDYKATVRRWL